MNEPLTKLDGARYFCLAVAVHSASNGRVFWFVGFIALAVICAILEPKAGEKE